MSKIRLGFIGCGGVAQNHFSGISTFEDVEMAAFCDLNAEVVEQTAVRYGGKPYTAHEQMFAEQQLDGAYIILPPFAHGPAELEAVRRKVPFFVEKPVGSDLGTIREIAAAVRQAGLLASAGYMTRYRQSVQEARRILAEDPAVMAHGGWIGGAPKMTAPIHGWWVVKEKSGGQLVSKPRTPWTWPLLMGEVVEVWAAAARGFVRGVTTYTNDDASLCTAEVCRRRHRHVLLGVLRGCPGDSKGVHFNLYARRHTVEFSGWDQSVKLYNADGWTKRSQGRGRHLQERRLPGLYRQPQERRPLPDPVRLRRCLPDRAGHPGGEQSMETGQPVRIE